MNIILKNILASVSALVLASGYSNAQILSNLEPNPANANLQLWLKADAGVTSGGNGTDVTLWENQSTSAASVGNAIPLSGLGNAPTFVASSSSFNGQSTISFNGTSQAFNVNTNSLLTGSGFTVFFVMQVNSPGGVQALLSAGGNFYGTLDNQLIYQTDTQYATLFSAPGSILGTTTYVMSLTHNGTAGGETSFFIDNTRNDDGAAISDVSTPGPGGIGYQVNGQFRFFGGEVAEILVYNAALTDADRIGVNDYLTAKYTAIPEPSVMALFGIGLGTLLMRMRRKPLTN